MIWTTGRQQSYFAQDDSPGVCNSDARSNGRRGRGYEKTTKQRRRPRAQTVGSSCRCVRLTDDRNGGGGAAAGWRAATSPVGTLGSSVCVCACVRMYNTVFVIPDTAYRAVVRERRRQRRRRRAREKTPPPPSNLIIITITIITIISVIAVAHARHDCARTEPECRSRLVRHTNFYLPRAIVMYDVFVVAIKPTAMSDPYFRVLVHCHTLPVTTAKMSEAARPSHVRMFSSLSSNVLIKVGWDQPGPAAVAFTAAEGSDRFLMGKTGRNSRRTGRGVGHFSRSYADKKKKKENNKCGDL